MKNSGRHLSMDAPLVEEKILTFMTLRSGESPNPDREVNSRIIAY
jgi:hypothetical protein